MVSEEYAKAYTEVIEILSHVPKKDIVKIPKAKIDFYKRNMDKEYKYMLDMSKDFKEQKMSKITEAILANIFRDFWATPYQRKIIETKEKYDLEKIDEEKRKKYDIDQIFKKTKNHTIVSNQENLQLEVKKENIFIRIIKKIKSILLKK